MDWQNKLFRFLEYQSRVLKQRIKGVYQEILAKKVYILGEIHPTCCVKQQFGITIVFHLLNCLTLFGYFRLYNHLITHTLGYPSDSRGGFNQQIGS